MSDLFDHFSLRPMVKDDISALVALEKMAQESPWGEQSFSRCLNPTFSGWLVENEQLELCAFGIIQTVADESHLLDIVVSPKLQGQGVGRTLLGFMIDRAREAGAVAMYLEVRQSNLAAKGLYQSMGFSVISERKNYYNTSDGGKEHALVMMRAI